MSLYYRRWTRMHLAPALRMFHKMGALGETYNIFKPLVQEQRDNEVPYKWRKVKRTKLDNLDEKLIDRLLTKYPDLKYESIERSKAMDNNKTDDKNMFSYAYNFINFQKDLIHRGYTIDKAFELTEKEFQSRTAKKLDNTLISRGLAIGNRARSMLTVYQQQSEFESRLKMLRTKRQIEKYEDKLRSIKETVEGTPESIYARTTYEIDQNELFPKEFKRDETVVQEDPSLRAQVLEADFDEQKDLDKVKTFEENIKSVFDQFYEVAAGRDRLEGLTDQQIKSEIRSSPRKIKNESKKLLKKLEKNGVSLNEEGEVDYSGVTNPRVKKLLENDPRVKYVLLAAALDFESPHHEHMREEVQKHKNRLSELREERKQTALTEEELQTILQNKKKAYEKVADYAIRPARGIYRLFQSYEERLLRMEIKWRQYRLSEMLDSVDTRSPEEELKRLDDTIRRLRRVKFLAEQRYASKTEGDLKVLFPEHSALDKNMLTDSLNEYEKLFNYLHKKINERRLSTLDQINDDRIHEIISIKKVSEEPLAEGFKRSDV